MSVFAVVDWQDVFTRKEYKQILIDSLSYCQKEKGMEIYAWCIMTNHVHLIFRSATDYSPQSLLGDFKRFTSRKLIQVVQINPRESRREILLKCFRDNAAKTSNCTKFQFWSYDNKPIQLWSNKVVHQKIRNIQMNPVEEGFAFRPEDYPYSSAVDYASDNGMLDGVIVVE